ncbi:MAG TPA: hypothetical protein VGE74_12610 [Gemmata sp.]
MKRVLFGLAAFVAGVALIASPAVSQPPEGKGKGGQFGKDGKGGMRGGFKAGTVLPPFMVEELKLTDDQKAKLAEIEKDVKSKLDKLLTAEQKKAMENFRPGPGGPGGFGGEKGGKGGDKGGKGGDKGSKGGDKGGKGERPPFDQE